MKLSNKPIVSLFILALAWTPCHAELADQDKPVHLEADRVSIDDASQTGTFEGNVQLTQGTMTIHADKLVVVQYKDGNTHGTATGNPASLRQKREGADEYIEGYGDRIEYDTRAATIELFGHARMKRREDEVRGDYIIYNTRTEIFQVRSAPGSNTASPQNTQPQQGRDRVRVIIQPRHAGPDKAQPPLTIQPDDTLSNPEENR